MCRQKAPWIWLPGRHSYSVLLLAYSSETGKQLFFGYKYAYIVPAAIKR